MASPISDAVRLIRARHSFDDLDAALSLIGVHLRAESVSQDWQLLATPEAPPPLDAQDSALNDFDLGESEGDYNVDLIRALQPDGAADSSASTAGLDHPASPGTGAAPGGLIGVDLEHGIGDGPRPASPRLLEQRRVICSILDPFHQAPPPPVPAYRSVPPPDTAKARPDPLDSALDQRTLGADLYSLVKVPRPGNHPDLDHVVAQIVRGEPISEVPLRPVPSAPFTLLVLIDLRLKVGPFAREADEIVQTLEQTLGRSRVRTWAFRFVDSVVCGPGPYWTWSSLAEQRVTEPTLLVCGPADSSFPGRAMEDHVARRRRAGLPTFTIVLGEASTRRDAVWSIDD